MRLRNYTIRWISAETFLIAPSLTCCRSAKKRERCMSVSVSTHSTRRGKMSENNWFRSAVVGALSVAFLCLACDSAIAQRDQRERNSINREERGLSCNDNWSGDRASHCLIKEQTIAEIEGIIIVDGKINCRVTG